MTTQHDDLTDREAARQRLVRDLLATAAWRTAKADEYTEDFRNERAASTLEAMAKHVMGLSLSDSRFKTVATLTVGWGAEASFLTNEASRIGFGYPVEDLDRALDHAITEAIAAIKTDADDD